MGLSSGTCDLCLSMNCSCASSFGSYSSNNTDDTELSNTQLETKLRTAVEALEEIAEHTLYADSMLGKAVYEDTQKAIKQIKGD